MKAVWTGVHAPNCVNEMESVVIQKYKNLLLTVLPTEVRFKKRLPIIRGKERKYQAL